MGSSSWTDVLLLLGRGGEGDPGRAVVVGKVVLLLAVAFGGGVGEDDAFYAEFGLAVVDVSDVLLDVGVGDVAFDAVVHAGLNDAVAVAREPGADAEV